jgi:protein-disulfide isomerase
MRAFILTTLLLASAPGIPAADAPVATVGTTSISHADLEKHVKAKLIEIDNERFEAMKEGLDDLVAEELFKQEAKARNVTPDALIKTEITDKIPAPSDADVQKLYDENKEALNNQPLEQVKPKIIEYLKQQSGGIRHDAFVDELKKKYPVKTTLRPPIVEVSTAGHPAKGPAAAPVTIVEFSDYQCPFCKRAEPTVKQVMDTYKDKIRLVFRNYPLPFHEHARPAAEAALCANAQGKFWEFHEKLFAAAALTDDAIKKLAADAGLDAAKFDECVKKGQFKADVDKDVAEGGGVGVNGTPAFFINGRMLSGAQPFEKFKEIIDDEIANGGKTS